MELNRFQGDVNEVKDQLQVLWNNVIPFKMQLTANLYDMKSIEQIKFEINLHRLRRETFGKEILKDIKNRMTNEQRKIEGK